MKTITFALFLFSFSALACKPGSLPQCPSLDVVVNRAAFKDLIVKVQNYQSYLSKNLVRPDDTSSCFDNHFGSYYASILEGRLDKNKNKSCREQLHTVKAHILKLINPETQENKALNSKDKKDKASSLAKEVTFSLEKALPLKI